MSLPRPALISAALLVLALSGCGDPAITPSGSPTPGATAGDSPSASPTPEAAWVTVTVPSGLATFLLPDDWSAEVVGTQELAIKDSTGAQRLTYLEQIGGIGGEDCESPAPFEVIDSADFPVATQNTDPTYSIAPEIAFTAVQYPRFVAGSVGTTNSLPGLDGVTCSFFNLIDNPVLGQFTFSTSFIVSDTGSGDPDDPQLTFTSMDEARAYVDTDDYQTLMRILTSFTIG